MADKIFVRPGTQRGSLNEDYVMFRDNGDGSFSIADEARLRGWDATDLVWTKLPVDHTTGALKVLATTASSTPTAVLNGGKNVAVTGTAVNLPAGACSGVVITANSTNAASIFVGTSAVTKDYGATTSGAELQPGQSVGLAIDNLNRVYVNGTAGDGVNWLAS